jgi:multiple sugar transport system substrate-binding protein
MRKRCWLALLALWPIASCRSERGAGDSSARSALVFKQQPLWGDAAPFAQLLRDFEEKHPGTQVRAEYLPNASDVAHQFYLTALESGGAGADFDVMVVDVAWVAEFARAGWALDLSPWFPSGELRENFLQGAADAATLEGRTYAVPWYVDVGLLYYRTDWVPRAPRTYAELQQWAREAMEKNPSVEGFVWQGKQYEGLNCNVFEAMWGFGGEPLADGRFNLNSKQTRDGLEFLRGLVESGISPREVATYAEEETRRAFGSGRAVFMRNWPYAYKELEKEGSPVRGRFAAAPLPSADGRPGQGALGGWHLAVNAKAPQARRQKAIELIRHLTSPEANLLLATAYARNPARADVYRSEALRQQAPFIASLLPAIERARPRPVSPWYMLLSDSLQGEFSAAISGLRPEAQALGRAQQMAERLSGGPHGAR